MGVGWDTGGRRGVSGRFDHVCYGIQAGSGGEGGGLDTSSRVKGPAGIGGI